MSESYLGPDNIDDLARMLMALLSEVWIMRDRMAVMETLLEERIGLTSADLDAFAPDAAFAAKLEALRDRVVGTVIAAPVAAKDRSVDSVLRRAGFHETADRLRQGAAPDAPTGV